MKGGINLMENKELGINFEKLDINIVIANAIITISEILDDKGIASKEEFLQRYKNNLIEAAKEMENK